MPRRRLRLGVRLAAACALAILALPAGAQGPGRARRGIAEACEADAARLCPGVGGVELYLCLDGRTADLSPACRSKVGANLARLRERHTLMVEACRDDAARLCPGVDPGLGQGLGRCLREHQAELSETCRTQLPPRPPR